MIEGSGKSLRAVALEAGIPYTTLDRRMRGDGKLTVSEMADIANAIGVNFTDLIPELLREEPAEGRRSA